MKRRLIAPKPLLAVPLALLLGGFAAASAQTAPAPAAPPVPPAAVTPDQHPPAQHAQAKPAIPPHVDDRITAMRKSLQITPAQEPAWDAFAQAMRDNAVVSAQAYQDRAAHLKTMTAVENLRSFAQLEETRAQNLQTLSSSFETLYGQLSDSQKQEADNMFRRQGERAAAKRAQHKHGAH